MIRRILPVLVIGMFWVNPAVADESLEDLLMKKGLITVTPLQFDMTQKAEFEEMKSWELRLSD